MLAAISIALLASTANAAMSKWDTTCGSKFDRIVTKNLKFEGGAAGKLVAGQGATLDTSGVTNLHGPFRGGSWSVRIYEEGSAHPVGDFFGDLEKVLDFPDKKNTTFAIKGVKFALPRKQFSGNFQISFTARDFEKASYFCVDVFYTLDDASPLNFANLNTPELLLPTFAPNEDPYTVSKQEGNFTVNTVAMQTRFGHFKRGAIATVTVTGKTKKALLSGAVSWQLYETGVKSFIASGNSDFFQCDNKGCDLSKPIALKLADTSGKAGSAYTLTFTFAMAKRHPGGTGEFRLVFWGSDQDHFPYDFSATIMYNQRN